MPKPAYLLVLSDADPVASAVRERLATGESTGEQVDGTPLRQLSPSVLLLRRAGLHIHDDHLDRRLPVRLQQVRVAIVFPSVHRSETGIRCFTCHSLGNFSAEASVGGEPRRLVPAAPRLATDALRRLRDAGEAIGLPATFEATHHGPALDLPAVFVEIATEPETRPDSEAVRILSGVLTELVEDAADRIAVGIGGGHYAPHFTDIALERRWAFGHIVPRHALEVEPIVAAQSALAATSGAEGLMFHRAADAALLPGIGPRLRESAATRRG
ncbi:MAG: D-aminoacyl-tRNA deacylase [Thermoplasmata archaeon]|nr:D-aminoacyl-tRNA deacylase [Thermoplasmata archaeon]